MVVLLFSSVGLSTRLIESDAVPPLEALNVIEGTSFGASCGAASSVVDNAASISAEAAVRFLRIRIVVSNCSWLEAGPGGTCNDPTHNHGPANQKKKKADAPAKKMPAGGGSK